MTAIALAGRRLLPRGWLDLVRQCAIWFGFLLAYQMVRGLADRDPTRAFSNGLAVIKVERHVNAFFELTLQRLVDGSDALMWLVSFTYWNSEFTVVGIALLWVYIRRNEHFVRLRNWILAANVIGLAGYAVLPTAPPRMFTDLGFGDTLSQFGALNHGSGLIEFASNPYAAMPSLHAADALIVGVSLALIAKHVWAKLLWLLWPAWVWFVVMATGNHFLLDIVAGIAVATLAAWIVLRTPWLNGRRRRATPESAPTAA